MDMAKRWSIDLPPRRPGKININEFMPSNTKVAGKEIIKEFLFQKDVATWFRGTSHYHIKGANKLFNALRDDGEQETTHRVRTCLSLIGVKPMITAKEIKFLMHLSRGNDLVFLWFLMEKHYKSPKLEPRSFSQNEQLICSAICHLDMVTTLRELDKILPRGVFAKKKKCPRRPYPKETCAQRKSTMSANQSVLPYFTECNPPRQYGKRLFLEQPNFRVQFKYYSHFKNPNYAVQNESNRWYANYLFSPGRRVVHSVIREIIKSIFYNFEMIALKARCSEILCGYHKTLKIMEAALKHELIVKARDECLTFNENEDRATKVKNRLNNAIQEQMCIFCNQTKTAPNHCTLKTITSDRKVYDVILGGNGFSNRDCKTTTNCESLMKKQVYASTAKYAPNALQRNKHRTDKRKAYNDDYKTAQSAIQKCTTERFNGTNSCITSDSLPAYSAAFFKWPSMHRPCNFDCHRIFSNFKHSEECGVRKIIMKALNEETSNLSTETNDAQILYDDAVKSFVENTFEKEVRKYDAAHIDGTTAHHAESSNPLKQYPSSANYSAENFYLMDEMLFKAFQHLRKNPKLVWAQLPDAHKVPFLREWIAHRFGKEYTATERAKSYRRSCLVFRALQKSNTKPPVPNANRIGKNFFVDYNCRKHVERKVQQIKSEYYQSLDAHFLEYTRAFWFAMRGYICSNGPPRKSFYAYMPSRLQDIQHFCLWKSGEYRNNWNAWNVRRKKGV